MIVETAQFRARPGVSDEQLLKASQEAQDGYLGKCRGFVSRELLKSEDGSWLDIVHFETLEAAQSAAKGFQGNQSTKALEDAIDPATARMSHYRVIKKY
jgi:heme-degrading monooxygenase HmoA